MDEGPSIAELLAHGFWNGQLPTDLSEEALAVLDHSAMGVPGLEQIEDLVTGWTQSSIDTDSLYANGMSLHDSFWAAASESWAAAEAPGSEPIRNLLFAVVEALFAMAEASAAVAEAAIALHGGAMQKALASAEAAAGVLQEVYDGTHFEG